MSLRISDEVHVLEYEDIKLASNERLGTLLIHYRYVGFGFPNLEQEMSYRLMI